MELKSLSLKNSQRPCKGTSPVMSHVKESCFASHKAFCEVSYANVKFTIQNAG